MLVIGEVIAVLFKVKYAIRLRWCSFAVPPLLWNRQSYGGCFITESVGYWWAIHYIIQSKVCISLCWCWFSVPSLFIKMASTTGVVYSIMGHCRWLRVKLALPDYLLCDSWDYHHGSTRAQRRKYFLHCVGNAFNYI